MDSENTLYIYKMEYYSVVKKKNKIVKFAGKWMALEVIIQTEVT